MPGDANGDSKVDVSDLGILAASYGLAAGAAWDQGDFNGDGNVDVSDLGILAANYGAGTCAGLDSTTDAQAFGLTVDEDPAEKEAAPGTSALSCGSGGLPLVAGLIVLGIFPSCPCRYKDPGFTCLK